MNRNFLTRIFTRLAMMSLIAMASGCGGGAGSGFGLEGYVIAKTVELYTSAQTIDPATEETESVTVTAIIKDAQNRVMAGQQVVFSASSGVSVGKVKDADGKETDSFTTDADGVARATVSVSDRSVRTIVVSAKVDTPSGQVGSSISIGVVGVGLTLTGPATVSYLGQATFIATLTDSLGNALDDQTVSISSANGNSFGGTPGTTGGGTGQVSFTMTGNNSGSDTITATGLGVSKSLPVVVASAGDPRLSFVAPALLAELPVKPDDTSPHTIKVRFYQSPGSVSDIPVTFYTTRGTFTTNQEVSTDDEGIASVSIESEKAGRATITACYDKDGLTCSVQAKIVIEFVSKTPNYLLVGASPSVVAVNTDGDPFKNSSQIIAQVLDAVGNPVKGALVVFQLDSIGGEIDQEKAQVSTDSYGIAKSVFYPGTQSTGVDAIKVKAKVGTTTIENTTSLTATKQFYDIAIGGGAARADGDALYRMDFVALVANTAGGAAEDVKVSASVVSIEYYKGEYCEVADRWVPSGEDCAFLSPPVACPSEDLNGNNLLDPEPKVDGYSLEDTNKDGKLTPGAIAILDDNSPPVFNGRATMSISYPQNFANWVKVRLRVSAAASTSLSTEGIDYVDVLLQAPNDALKAGDNGNPAPPGGMFASPFGVAADCSVPN